MTQPASTPAPPYYAVVFTSTLMPDDDGYEDMAVEMAALAAEQPGFLGLESARGADGLGVTVSYWQTVEAIEGWRAHLRHCDAQRLGRERWYASYALRVCRVERATTFPNARQG